MAGTRLTIYLSDPIADEIRDRAAATGQTLSIWFQRTLEEAMIRADHGPFEHEKMAAHRLEALADGNHWKPWGKREALVRAEHASFDTPEKMAAHRLEGLAEPIATAKRSSRRGRSKG